MWALQEVQICKDKDPNSLIREHYDKNLLKNEGKCFDLRHQTSKALHIKTRP
jgi:hypothetical protein